MISVTRREALSAMLAIASLGLAGDFPAEILEPGLGNDDDDNEPEDYHKWAGVLARLELSAIRSLHPNWWQRLHYTGSFHWAKSPSILVFYGIGARWQTDQDVGILLAWMAADYGTNSPTPIIGCYRTPCGRSWAVFVHADCPGHLDDVPAWRDAYGEQLKKLNRSRGPTVTRAFIV